MDEQDVRSIAYGSQRQPTLRDIAAPLFRHRKLVLLTFLGLVLSTVLGIVLLPKAYEAQIKILVKRERVDSAVSPGRDSVAATPGNITEEELNSEVELLKSRDLLEKVVVACHLQESQHIPFGGWLFSSAAVHETDAEPNDQKSISQAVLTLEDKLHIQVLKKTNLIQVTYSSPDPQLAAQVLSVLSNLYLEKTVAAHRSSGTFEFFQAEAQHYRQQLQTAQAQLANFDRDKNVTDPQLEKQSALQRLSEFESALSATQVAIQETESRTRTLEVQLASTPEQAVFQIRKSDNPYLMQQLKTTLLNLELKRTELLAKFEPSYRPVQEVQAQIEQTLEAIAKAEESPVHEETTNRNPSYEWLQSELTKSNADLASLHARATATRSATQQYRTKLDEIHESEMTQQDLIREVKETEANYLLYAQKREEARIGDALDRQKIMDVAIAETATVPALPAYPHRALALLVGLLLASFVSPGLAFAVDYFDPSVRTPDELREALQIPVLAALPSQER